MNDIVSAEKTLVKVITLPEIETTINQLMPFIETRCAEATKTACTEESRQSVKALRAQLNKESKTLKDQFKTAMAEVKAPIIAAEDLFKKCMSAYSDADAALKAQIDRVENGIKTEKETELKEYFNEYATSVELEGIPFERAVPKVNMTVSVKKYKETIKAFLDGIKNDLELIYLEEYRDEILIEYNKDYDLSNAMYVVKKRHEAIEEARKMREMTQNVDTVSRTLTTEQPHNSSEEITEGITEQDEPLAPPTAEPENIKLTFGIYGTLEQLKAFKPELIELIERHGLRYE